MKALTRIRLVNWHLFTDVTISCQGTTYFIGVNGAGKSTVLDAVQFALVGGQRDVKFNQAALAGAPQAGEMAGAADHQHRLVGMIFQVVADFYAATRQPLGQLVLEGDHPAHASQVRRQAKAVQPPGCFHHGGRFPTQRAGMPAQISPSPVDSSRTALAPTTVPRPTCSAPALHRTFAPGERITSSSMTMLSKADCVMGR